MKFAYIKKFLMQNSLQEQKMLDDYINKTCIKFGKTLNFIPTY